MIDATETQLGELWEPGEEESATSDPQAIESWIDRFGDHPLSVLLLLNRGELFVRKGVGAVGFFRWRKGVIAVGGALSPDPDHRKTVEAFLGWCERQGLVPRFVHFPTATAKALAALGFRIDQLGASYSLAFQGGDLPGKNYQQVRRKLNKAMRAGVTIEHVSTPDRYTQLLPEFHEINRQWLRQKGAKHIKLLVGDFDKIGPDPNNRIYAAWSENELIAYLVFTKTLGKDAGWFHNLSRRKTGCIDGTMQLIVSRFMQDMGHGNIHFGFTPLVEISEPAYPHSAIAAWIARRLEKLGGIVYPARSQRQYKISWCPTDISPEYLAYRGSTLGAIVWFLRATNSI